MTTHDPLTEPKNSKYETYRTLKYQEIINPKNKFDNRLYFSQRYKIYNYTDIVTDELLKNNFSLDTLQRHYMVIN